MRFPDGHELMITGQEDGTRSRHVVSAASKSVLAEDQFYAKALHPPPRNPLYEPSELTALGVREGGGFLVTKDAHPLRIFLT